MKQKILSIFSLLLILLISCTIFSLKIEEEMTLDVVIIDAVSSPIRPLSVPASSLFYDEEGYHLYGIYEGEGWEAGTRVEEIPKSEYVVSGTYVKLTEGRTKRVTRKTTRAPENGITEWHIIKTASRQPEAGELVKNYDSVDLVDDSFLAIYPDGIPEEYSLNSFYGKIVSSSENAILFEYNRAITPFMEHNTKGQLESRGVSALGSENWRLYSVSEIERFMDSMVYVTGAVILLVFALILWGVSSFLAKDWKKYKKYILLNCGGILLLICCVALAVQKIDLPSSLLPSENIFSFRHYIEEFSVIFDAFKEFG